jgi:hypothetical protein
MVPHLITFGFDAGIFCENVVVEKNTASNSSRISRKKIFKADVFYEEIRA